MDVFESIADRRIAAARAAGLFDNLALAGKPIPDIDQERPPGWWATRFVERERRLVEAEELEDQARRHALPAIRRT